MRTSNDHYVPQFLLRKFSDQGKVHIFNKVERRTFATTLPLLLRYSVFLPRKLRLVRQSFSAATVTMQ